MGFQFNIIYDPYCISAYYNEFSVFDLVDSVLYIAFIDGNGAINVATVDAGTLTP